MFEFFCEVGLCIGEVCGLRHIDEIGAQRQHHGCFDKAAMNIERLVFRCNQPFRHTEACPACGHSQHIKAGAKLSCNDCHQRRVAAMGIEHDQLANAACMKVLAHADPLIDGFREGEALGAFDVHMFDGIANRLGRQEIDVEIGRQCVIDARDNTFGDNRICFKWQMRTMLLVGAKWQDDDHVAVLVAQVIHIFLRAEYF